MSTNGSSIQHVPVTVEITKLPRDQPINIKTQDQRNWYSTPDWWVAVFTGLLFISTTGLWAFTAFMWRATKRLAVDSSRSTRAIVAMELPIVFLDKAELFEPSPFVSEYTNICRRVIASTPQSGSHLKLTFKNYGRTPARVDALSVSNVSTKELPPTPGPRIFRKFGEGTVIRPGRELTGDRFIKTIDIPEDDRNLISEGQASLWVYGALRYRDFMGEIHDHRFCMRWFGYDPPETSDSPAGFFADGPASYRESN